MEQEHFPGSGDADPAADSDDDGAFNWQEYLAGTNPTNCDSALQIESSVTATNGGYVIRWASEPWRLYSLERSSNLTSRFTVLESDIVATPPVNAYTDSEAAGAGPFFYRIRLNP